MVKFNLKESKFCLDRDNIFDILLIGLILLAMTLASPDWIFTRGGIDGWMYYGYFKHYDLSQILDDNKKIARLPWILLGFFTHKLFSDETANYILHLGLVFLGGAVFYKTVFLLFNRMTAFVTTLAFITYLPGLGSGGWDYHNTLAGPLYLFSYFLLMMAATSPDRIFLKFSLFGIFLALTVHTNILFLLLLPALILEAVHQRQSGHKKKPLKNWIVTSVVGTVFGGLFITVLLGVINVLYGREFFFFNKLASRSTELLVHPSLEKDWWMNWHTFWWLKDGQTPYIESVLLMIAIVTFVGIWKRNSPTISRLSATSTVYLGFLVSLAPFVFFQILGHPMLQPYYMAYPLVLPTFFALAGLVFSIIGHENVVDSSPRWSFLHSFLSAMIFVVIFLPLALGNIRPPKILFSWIPRIWENGEPILLLLGGFSLAVFISFFMATNRNAISSSVKTFFIALSLLVGFSIANAEWTPSGTGGFLGDYCHYGTSYSRFITSADSYLLPYLLQGKSVRLVYDGLEEVSWAPNCSTLISKFGNPLISMGYDSVIPWTQMISLSKIPRENLYKLEPSRDILAVLTANRNFVKTLIQDLQKINPRWSIIGNFLVLSSPLKLRVFLIGIPKHSITLGKS